MKTEHGSWELELILDLKSNLIKLLHKNKVMSFKVYFEVMGCIRMKARTFQSTYKKLFFVRMWSILLKTAVLPLEYYVHILRASIRVHQEICCATLTLKRLAKSR
jgi:hypothetical protein